MNSMFSDYLVFNFQVQEVLKKYDILLIADEVRDATFFVQLSRFVHVAYGMKTPRLPVALE